MDTISIEELTKKRLANPWIMYTEPFHVVDNIYFLGNSWVSSFLVDTQEGLILIDCAMQETSYQLIDSIHRLGFDPMRIKKLLISHAHFDHCGAARIIQELSGCEIWLGKDDLFFLTDRRDLIYFEDRVPEFLVYQTYDYNSEIELGGVSIKPVHCPGHTPGTTSFLLQAKVGNKQVTCAMHGGLGINTLSREVLDQLKLPLSLQDDYRKQLTLMMDMKVDVLLPSHPGHVVEYDFLGLGHDTKKSEEKFVDPTAWGKMLSAKLKQFDDMNKEDLPE